MYKETITINRKIVKDISSPPRVPNRVPSPPSAVPEMTPGATNSETENEIAEISQHISAPLSRRSSRASSTVIVVVDKQEVEVTKKTEEFPVTPAVLKVTTGSDNDPGALNRHSAHSDLRVVFNRVLLLVSSCLRAISILSNVKGVHT